MKAAWIWVKGHVEALLAGAVLLLGAYLLWRRNQDRVASLGAALEVERARREVARLEERRDNALARANAREADLHLLDAAITQNKRAVVQAHTEAAHMTPTEVTDAFTRLGY